MKFAKNADSYSQTLSGWRRGHNPLGLEGEQLAPGIFKRMLAGEITPHEAMTEHNATVEGRQDGNDAVRAAAGMPVDRSAPAPGRDEQGRFTPAGEEGPTGMNKLIRERIGRGPAASTASGTLETDLLTPKPEPEPPDIAA
jgi:hypothetical protein